MKLIIRILVTMAALFVAAYLIPGITIQGSSGWIALLIMAVVMAVVNALVRPLLTLLSCGFIVLTMGLFLLVINALTFLLSANIAQNWFGAGFIVDGFWPALWGSIVVSIVSFILNMIFVDGGK